MIHTKRIRALLVALGTVLAVVALPVIADAQRRGPIRRAPAVRSVVVIRGYAYPRYFYYDPWFDYGWAPYGLYGYQYGAYGRSADLITTVRLDATPREAEVFVDGYSAGIVDKFDGVFQRLRLRPGGHEITLYLNGYRTLRRNIYLQPGANERIRLDMQPLAPGETAELPPAPSADESGDADRPFDEPARPGDYGRPAPRPGPGPSRSDDQAINFGTLSLAILPGDAEILIDGERWTAGLDEGRAQIRLAEGRHRVDVRKDGFARYTEEVLIRSGASLRLNVSLTRQ